MKSFTPRSAVAQLTDHLREQILGGVLGESMPGVNQLVRELGLGTQTVIAAVAALEKEGLLENRGGRRGRRILTPEGNLEHSLHVRLLLFNKGDEANRDTLDLMHHLHMSGHQPEIASRSLWSLGMDPQRVARFVESNPADAWLVIAASREILEWFAEQPFPSFALLGGFRGLGIAGTKPNKLPAQSKALRRLAELGHRRIVKLVLKDRITPVPGRIEQSFLDNLESLGIPTGPYNLAAWSDRPAKFYEQLDALFGLTPPTALFLDAVSLFYAARDHLAQKGIVAPRDVSLICNDPDPSFEWMQPSVAHLHWSFKPLARRVVRWLENVSSGKDDRRQTLPIAKFVEGDTIGPVRKVRAQP